MGMCPSLVHDGESPQSFLGVRQVSFLNARCDLPKQVQVSFQRYPSKCGDPTPYPLPEQVWCMMEVSPEQQVWCMMEVSPEQQVWRMMEVSPGWGWLAS